jgi:hypothetical protein
MNSRVDLNTCCSFKTTQTTMNYHIRGSFVITKCVFNNFQYLFLFSFADQLPKSITYNLEPSATTGISSSVKIDILAPAISQSEVPSMTDKSAKMTHYQSPSKYSKMTNLDELNVISHEIDKQITKKANETLELLKELLSGALDKSVFLTRMSETSDTTQSDLLSIAKKLWKRYKFESNPNFREFCKIKFLQFPTSSKDLSKFKIE